MQDSLNRLFVMLEDVSKLVDDDIELAIKSFASLEVAIEGFFSSGDYKAYTKSEVEYLSINLHETMMVFIEKQKNIRSEIDAFNKIASNKVTRRYLEK